MADEKKKTYKLTTGLWKSLIKSAIIAIPAVATIAIGTIPITWKEMTLGALLVYVTNFATNWVKNK